MGKTLSENNLSKLIETIKSNSDSLYVSKSSQNSNEMQTDIDNINSNLNTVVNGLFGGENLLSMQDGGVSTTISESTVRLTSFPSGFNISRSSNESTEEADIQISIPLNRKVYKDETITIFFSISNIAEENTAVSGNIEDINFENGDYKIVKKIEEETSNITLNGNVKFTFDGYEHYTYLVSVNYFTIYFGTEKKTESIKTNINNLTNIASNVNARMVYINRAKLITDESINIPNEYTDLVKINDHKIDITLNDENREVSFYFSTYNTLYTGQIYQLMYNISSSNELETKLYYSGENSKIHMSLDSIERPTNQANYDYNAIHKGVNYFDIMVSQQLSQTNSIKISFSLRSHITEEIKFSISNLFVCIDDITTRNYLTLLRNNQLQNVTLIYMPISTHYDIAPEDKMVLFEELKPKKTSGHTYPDMSIFPEELSPTFFNSYAKAISSDNNYILTEDDIYKIEHLDVSKFQSLCGLFNGFYFPNDSLNLSNWDTKNLKSLRYFFACEKYASVFSSSKLPRINVLNLSNWDVRNVITLAQMFYSNDDVTTDYPVKINKLILNNWKNTENITSTKSMFYGTWIEEVDLSSMDLSYVRDCSYMFQKRYANSSSAQVASLKKLKWGGALNATPIKTNYDSYPVSLDLQRTLLDVENAEIFFNSLSPKTTEGDVVIHMPTTAQGADISIATEKGYTITGITAP